MKKARPKLKSRRLILNVRWHLDEGRYLDTRHAVQRQMERKILRPEILYVLRRGRHERRKDRYQKRFQAWNYAIRGKTPDQKELRVIVSFDKNNMLIITAIDLRAKKHEKRKDSKDLH